LRRAIHGLAAALAASAALLGSALAQLTVMVSWADWCGACRILGPKLDAAAARFAGKVELIFIDFTDLSEANMERQFDRARPLRPEDFMDGPYLKTGFAYILVDGRLAGEISAGMAVADIVAALEEAQD
jgi:thiol-disulfide isomerase/thioredoxin